jgi:precorrin-6x reductase
MLTTGSKDLAAWRAGLADKTLLARVLPVPEVVQQPPSAPEAFVTTTSARHWR